MKISSRSSLGRVKRVGGIVEGVGTVVSIVLGDPAGLHKEQRGNFPMGFVW